MQTYNFTKSPLALDRLEHEIRSSAIVTSLNNLTAIGAALSITFNAALSGGDETLLNTIVTNHTGEPLPQNQAQLVSFEKETSLGIPKVSMYEPEGSAATIVSHNFCDKCSWFAGSLSSTNEVLTTSDDLVFNSTHTHWIDLTHGRVYDEDTINASGTYNVTVKVDDVVVTTGFSIDYALGKVTFNTSQAGKTIKATYKYADKSYFVIKPNASKILSIKAAEVQFTTDVQVTSPLIFEAWYNHPTYGWVPVPNTKIAYKNAKDFISAANEGQGLIPKWGELAHDIHVFPFNYARPKPIKASDNVAIRVYTLNDIPLTGEFATGTFYVAIDPEE